MRPVRTRCQNRSSSHAPSENPLSETPVPPPSTRRDHRAADTDHVPALLWWQFKSHRTGSIGFHEAQFGVGVGDSTKEKRGSS